MGQLAHDSLRSQAGMLASDRPVIDVGREVCGHLPAAERREWLVTNGIGGYGCGTVAGLLTRRYHGLLIAALEPPLRRTLLVTKLDETATYGFSEHGRRATRDYPLFANRWAGGVVGPTGFHFLQRFHLEGTTPVWTYACADALLEKRVWMQPSANTTYVRYDLQRATAPLTLTIKALVNYRDHHATTRANQSAQSRGRMDITPVEHGLRIMAFDGAVPFYVLSDDAETVVDHTWYRGYSLTVEAYRGLDAREDHLCAGHLHIELQPGDSLTVVASTDAAPNLDGKAAYDERLSHECRLLEQSAALNQSEEGDDRVPSWVRHLTLAADQFIVRRSLPEDPDGRSIIAGYPWFGDWGRDTMISLPGLTLVTGRHEIAKRILRTFAYFVEQGMLPNRFPEDGGATLSPGLMIPPARLDYNTVDATLWYVDAIRAYYAATGDRDLLRDLYPVLQDIIDWHQRGTRYNIHADPGDGLLYAGEPGVQLTWMDAKVDDWVVTPRIGKPVEVNALWYNALCIAADVAHCLGESASHFEGLADRARNGFDRFWNAEVGYCYDVLDGPQGDDSSLRPNQLLAVSLPHSPLSEARQRAVVDVCARHLLTSHGLRSLSPDDPAFIACYGGDQRQRDAAYHQGTVWGWLIGAFVVAYLRVYGDSASTRSPKTARSFLEPLRHHVGDHAVGSISEIFDGAPPFTPRGCIAQAWSVAEVLRAWQAVIRHGGRKMSLGRNVRKNEG